MRALIVDDEQPILETFSQIFQLNGHAVSTADSAHAAKSLLQTERFDFLLCDLKMERDESGFEVITDARARQPDLPVILMTAWMTDVVVLAAAKLDITLVEKPFPLDQVMRTVENLAGDHPRALNRTAE